MTDPHRYCVIMCGGIGSRFWPYSRRDYPKQFIDFLGTGRSLLQMTYDRIRAVVRPENVLVLTNAAYAAEIARQLPDIAPEQILPEPDRRNTAPCIAWAASHIYAKDPEASMIVTPSDHLITREEEFTRCVLRGFEFVEQAERLLTMGIKPTRPETGYGYIQIGSQVEPGFMKVKTFTEKPERQLAEVFVASGEFFWNSGIFLWRAKAILNALRSCVPDIYDIFAKGKGLYSTPQEMDFINRHFPGAPSISIDYAVMEKASNVFVETVDYGWSDLGTWSSLYDNSPKNRAGNVAQRCRVVSRKGTGNIFAVKSDKLVVVKGLDNYIVADADDVLLIWPKDDEQELRGVVGDVKMAFGDKYI